LKILASEYFDQPYGNRELEISQWIANADPSHCGVNSLRTITDYFVVSGARNSHLCLVYEPMGEAITALQHCLAGDRIPPDILKELLKFMLLGLDYLHTKCGVIHTGAMIDSPIASKYDDLTQKHRYQAPEYSPWAWRSVSYG
jgi:serine/threonine-protein kinase SRPK3